MIKRFLCVLTVIISILFSNSIVLADSMPKVVISVEGKIEANEDIKIIINVLNIDSFYAGAVKFKYDNKILKVSGFEKGNLITKSGVNTYDVGSNIDEVNGIAEYKGFSCLGNVNGFSGSGVFLIIDAHVLKKGSFNINSIPFLSNPDDNNNLKIQLIDNNIKELDYSFTGFNFKVNSDGTTSVLQAASTEQLNRGSSNVSSNNSIQNGTSNDYKVNGKTAEINSNNTGHGLTKNEKDIKKKSSSTSKQTNGNKKTIYGVDGEIYAALGAIVLLIVIVSIYIISRRKMVK